MLQALIIVRNKPFDEITWLLKIAGKITSEYSQLWLDKHDKGVKPIDIKKLELKDVQILFDSGQVTL